ncbi:MAG: ABC transporter substrate-binding protein [Butyricicoccus pullicaecorum]|nr:ABC transporter substrate-binding protein [Butyricicoccus pullicaecorum]
MKRMLCLLLTLLVSGCTAAPDAVQPLPDAAQAAPPPPAYDRLTIYSPLPEEELLLYCSAFRKDTGITVDCERLSAGEMIARVQAERENPAASVLLGGSADNYVQAQEAGLLKPYQSPEMVHVPEAYLDKSGVWNPIYVGVICFACNRDWFERKDLPLPADWDDLLRPELAGQVVMASPVSSGTSYTMLAALVQQRGEPAAWEYLRALDANVGRYTRSGLEPVEWVKNGNHAVGIVFSHDGRRAALDGYPVELQYPTDGTGFEIGACALVRGGPKEERENARKFVDWMTSQRGQECYIEAKSSRLPANTAARTADGLPAFSELNLIDYDPEWAGENRARLIAAFEKNVTRAQTQMSSP